MRKLNSDWSEPSIEQEQITALSSELQKLKEDKGKSKIPRLISRRGQERNRNPTNNRGWDKDWAWKKISLDEGEPDFKSVKGILYHWCVNHQAWTFHKQEDCRLSIDLKNSEAKSATSKTDKCPLYKEALQTIISSIEVGEEESTNEEWGCSSASDPFYISNTSILAVPWVCKLLTWY